jgi:glycosyltransferase involved in cell wall biosynthesis
MERPLRIAIVCDAVTDCIAGSFVSTRRFADLLKARGHTILFIASRSPMSPTDDEHNGIKAYRFASILLPKTEGQFYLGFPTFGALRRIFQDERIDVVHSMIPTPAAITATRAARSLSIPVVAHSHTQPDNLFMHLPFFFPIQTLSNLFYRYLNWIYGKAEVISNGVDSSVFMRRDPAAFLEKFHIPAGRTRIVFVGRIHPEKSIDTLIRATPFIFKNGIDIQTIIVGFGHMEHSLQKLARELGVADRVTFTGKVDTDDLVSAYSAADLFVMPSLAELEGMAVLEAMACGAPVLIADAPESAARYFVDGNGALFRPGDEKHLAQEATRLLQDPSALSRMRDASLAKSRNYDINVSVARIEDAYRRLLHHD